MGGIWSVNILYMIKLLKIVYIAQGSDRYGGISGITPYYVLDENGKPENRNLWRKL